MNHSCDAEIKATRRRHYRLFLSDARSLQFRRSTTLKRRNCSSSISGFYPGSHVRGCKQEPGGPPSPPLPFRALLSLPLPSLPLEVAPLNSARWSGERCKIPQRGLGRSPSRNWIWCILTLKYDIWWQQFYWFSTSGCQVEPGGLHPLGGLHKSVVDIIRCK